MLPHDGSAEHRRHVARAVRLRAAEHGRAVHRRAGVHVVRASSRRRAARSFRYSVIFTNEDGGTPTDRLMATWGRTTDIEYVYSVEVDARGRHRRRGIPGARSTKCCRSAARREGRHPLLWVSTENNMVLRRRATSRPLCAGAACSSISTGVSREAVMDAQPVALRRDGAGAARAKARSSTTRRRATGQDPGPAPVRLLEACGEVGNAALAFAVGVRDAWIAVRPRHAPVPHRARRLFPRRDSAAGGDSRGGHPRGAGARLRAAARRRKAAGPRRHPCA